MLDITGAVFTRLSSDATLLALLAAYGSGRALVSDPPPADLIVQGPEVVCIVAAPFDDEAEDTYTEDYRRTSLNVRLYSRPNGSTLALDTAAERVRALLKTWPAGAVTGGTLIDAAVSGPVAGPSSDPSVEGRIVTARLIFLEA
jgi:hypothetical protein